MNECKVMGRFINVKESGEKEKSRVLGTLAVQREFKNKEGNYDTDFLNITLWGKQAEYILKYLAKNGRMIVTGPIYTRVAEIEEKKVTIPYIKVDKVEIIDWKGKDNGTNDSKNEGKEFEIDPEEFDSLDISEDDLPY